jgi:putative transposase
MARLARAVVVDVAHHVTQRGNARQFLLASEAERSVYLDLLRQSLQQHPLSLIGYCLMSNHVHLVVIPRKEQALAKALKEAHGRYASYWNGAHASSGHAWQGRFYSCPLDAGHLWEGLRYAELEPGSGRDGSTANTMEMVQCGSTLRRSRASSFSGHGLVETTLDRGPMAGISRRG